MHNNIKTNFAQEKCLMMIKEDIQNKLYKVLTTGHCGIIFCFKSLINCLTRMEHYKHFVSSWQLSLIPRWPLAKSPQQRRTCWRTIVKLHIRTRIQTRIGWTFTQDKVSKPELYNFVSRPSNFPGTISGCSIVTLWVVWAAYFATAWERNYFSGTNCKQQKRSMWVWENKHRLISW